MAELNSRLEALERRLQGVEAALRAPPSRDGARGARGRGVPITFEDVAVQFSREEWANLDDEQQELYRSVMQDNYETLVSIYCALAKPELLCGINRRELDAPVESGPGRADVSLEPATQLDQPMCLGDDDPLEMKTENPARELEQPRCPGDDGPLEARIEESSNRNLEESRSLEATASRSAPHVPHEATAVPADLSQPTPSPSCPLSVCCHEAVNPSPPPAAADAEVGIPTEIPQEKVAAEKPAVPEMSLKAPEEGEVRDSGKGGQDPAAAVPQEPGQEAMPGACGATAEPGANCTGEPMETSCTGRPAMCQRNATREKFYSCLVCRKNFLLKINLLIHQRSHSNYVPYVCTHCNCSFMSKKKIGRHLRARAAKGFCQPSETEEHSSLALSPASQPPAPRKPSPKLCPRPPGKVMHRCNECMENFSSLSFLILHRRQHTNHLVCPSCNRSFTWASDFVRHHHTYAGERPYQCGICQKTFKRHYHLVVHQKKMHMQQNEPFPCKNQLPVPEKPVEEQTQMWTEESVAEEVVITQD